MCEIRLTDHDVRLAIGPGQGTPDEDAIVIRIRNNENSPVRRDPGGTAHSGRRQTLTGRYEVGLAQNEACRAAANSAARAGNGRISGGRRIGTGVAEAHYAIVVGRRAQAVLHRPPKGCRSPRQFHWETQERIRGAEIGSGEIFLPDDEARCLAGRKICGLGLTGCAHCGKSGQQNRGAGKLHLIIGKPV